MIREIDKLKKTTKLKMFFYDLIGYVSVVGLFIFIYTDQFNDLSLLGDNVFPIISGLILIISINYFRMKVMIIELTEDIQNLENKISNK